MLQGITAGKYVLIAGSIFEVEIQPLLATIIVSKVLDFNMLDKNHISIGLPSFENLIHSKVAKMRCKVVTFCFNIGIGRFFVHPCIPGHDIGLGLS